ncbi:MAG: deoxyribose-phosphate aldolase [Deltaproteobacteria bacterium]|nr:deoxyribose-phosphate aldolase [Deltaproteobacteria bacterium]
MAGRIEHTLLGVSANDADVERLCREAREHQFRGVCCLPRDVARCRDLLEGTEVMVVTVLDFPLAGGTPEDAAAECARVIGAGAGEVDMVIDVRSLLQGNLEAARDGVARVVEAAGSHPVKVILETGALGPEQIIDGCAAAEAGGASFVKTATGFGPRGASVEDIRIMRACVGDRLGVKASGGVRTRDDAERMIAAGADVLGTSSGPACATV